MRPEVAIVLLFVGVIAFKTLLDLPEILKSNKSDAPVVFTSQLGLEQTKDMIMGWVLTPDKKGRQQRHKPKVSPQGIEYVVGGIGVRLHLAPLSETTTKVSATPIPLSTQQAKLLVFIPIGPKRIAWIDTYFRSVRELQAAVEAARVA